MKLTRRDFLRTGAAAGAVLLAHRRALRPWEVLAAGRRLNILWISCEDISPHLGCYGDPHAITPTLDRLAAEGVRYTNAYTVAGVCAPSRSGIISGMYPSTLGSQHMRCRATLPPFVKGFPHYLRQAGYYCTNRSKTDYNMNVPMAMWDESGGKAHWRKRAAGQPFFSVFNYTMTHESQTRADAKRHLKNTRMLKPSERQDPKKLTTLPPYYPDTPAARRDWAQNYELITALDYRAAGLLKQLEEDGLAGDTIVFFWSDHGVGLPRAKRWLYDSGTRVPLIVRTPEKLRVGEQGGPGTVDDRMISFIDLGPTALNLAGVEVPAHMQGRPFLGPDLPPPRGGDNVVDPTAPRGYIYGARDRMDERYDIIRSVRDKRYRYIRNYEPFKPYYQYLDYAERTPTMKELRRLHKEGKLPPAAEIFMASSKPVEELYDLQRDPHEIRNLAGSGRHRSVLERMRAEHVRWMLQTRDTGLLPEAELEEREKKCGSRFAVLRRPGGEALLRRLVRTATAAGDPQPADRALLLNALKDDDAAVRYWAVTGLGLLFSRKPGRKPGRSYRPLVGIVRKTLEDERPVVRIAAARALCMMNTEVGTLALPALVRELETGPQWARVLAVNVIDDLAAVSPAAVEAHMDAIKRALKYRPKYIGRVAKHTLDVLAAAR